MTNEERVAHAKQSQILAHERQLRAVMLDIYAVGGWAGVTRAVTKIQQELWADMKSRNRQGEGGWIF
jgi:hypothetical protein